MCIEGKKEEYKESKIEKIAISPNNNICETLTWHNSANILCNYMRKAEYLYKAIKNLALMPRYFEEKMDYLNVGGFTSIAFPMICFCDIPLSKVASHMSEYGSYGIALKKHKFINKDIQPISYLNTNSRLCNDFTEALQKLFGSERIPKEWEIIPNAILSQLLYTKPISGIMKRVGYRSQKMLFQDECEWRYIPENLGDYPLFIPVEYLNDKGIKKYSDALNKRKETWLRFDVKDIEYIIVPDEREAGNLIDFIIKMRGLKGVHIWNKTEKSEILSKIEIAEKFDKNLI